MQQATLVEVYIDAFRRRSAAMAGPHGQQIDQPGVLGIVDSVDRHRGRLLVVDDRAVSALPELARHAHLVAVFAAAARSDELLAADSSFAAMGTSTAMVCADLAAVPDAVLPDGLQLHRVHRLPDDGVRGVPLEAAAAACLRADNVDDDSLEGFVGYLKSLPAEAHLFAAVDADGQVRATAASGCFGADANAFFVSTDPQWRGRGIATAMTAIALQDAHRRGARLACLDATSAGQRIYERLGFVAAGTLTMFMRAD